jgi:hypothetical protein
MKANTSFMPQIYFVAIQLITATPDKNNGKNVCQN